MYFENGVASLKCRIVVAIRRQLAGAETCLGADDIHSILRYESTVSFVFDTLVFLLQRRVVVQVCDSLVLT